jgi:O-antigen/teichoic acid export membrane protein
MAFSRATSSSVSNPLFPPTMRLFGLVIVFAGVVKVHAAVLRSIGSARGEVTFNRLLRPAVRLASAVGAVALGYSVVGVAGALVAGTAILAVGGLPTVVRASGVRPALRGSRTELRGFFNYAAPIELNSFGKVFQNRVDILLVGALLTATAAGVYSIVIVLATIAWIPL